MKNAFSSETRFAFTFVCHLLYSSSFSNPKISPLHFSEFLRVPDFLGFFQKFLVQFRKLAHLLCLTNPFLAGLTHFHKLACFLCFMKITCPFSKMADSRSVSDFLSSAASDSSPAQLNSTTGLALVTGAALTMGFGYYLTRGGSGQSNVNPLVDPERQSRILPVRSKKKPPRKWIFSGKS